MTVSPRYDQYKDAWDTEVLAEVNSGTHLKLRLKHLKVQFVISSLREFPFHVQIKVGDRVETVRFFHCYKRGVDRVFVDHPLFLEKV